MKARGRTGAIQGPLLMGEDIEGECVKRAGPVRPDTEARAEGLRRRLGALEVPRPGRVPDPPRGSGAGSVLYRLPFPALCRTVGLGTGVARAERVREDHGRFEVSAAAGPGQYGYAVSSPCCVYVARAGGWVRLAFAVTLSGAVAVEREGDGAAACEVGLFAAHCWPKEEGKYWAEPRLVVEEARTERLEGELFSLEAFFPVREGVKYSFGAGLTTIAWARGGAASGARLAGQLAYVLTEPASGPPEATPYRPEGTQRGHP